MKAKALVWTCSFWRVFAIAKQRFSKRIGMEQAISNFDARVSELRKGKNVHAAESLSEFLNFVIPLPR